MQASRDGRRTSRRAFLRATAMSIGVTGAVGTAAAQEAAAQEAAATVQVGPGGDLVFTPGTDDPLYVAPGETVAFEWDSDGHNIVVDSQPDGANWEGTAGGPSKLYDTGHSYTHTFETTGTYEYFCQPHKSAGMVGTIIVNERGAAPTPAAPDHPTVPGVAKGLSIAGLSGTVSVLGLTYFFSKFGGDYRVDEE